MSAEDPAVVQCRDVLRDVSLFLDNELDPLRRLVVEQHLIDCPPCLDETDIGHRLKSLLHRKCGGDTAPQDLRDKLISALSVQMSAFGSADAVESILIETSSTSSRELGADGVLETSSYELTTIERRPTER